MRFAQRALVVVRPLLIIVIASCGRPDAPVPASTPVVARSIAIDALPGDANANPCPVDMPSLGAGLTVERWPIAATPAAGGPACIDVVRADLARYRLRVLSSGDAGRTALVWRDGDKLAAVTNAGMFHAGGAPVGLVIANGVERGTDNQKFSGVIAGDPISPDDPPVVVAGKGCTGFDLAALRRRYRSLVQSYRLLGCDGNALPWQDPKQYSAAGIGVDRTGRIVFVHARAAVTMAELSKALAAHDLAGALFLEGGPEASLVVRGPDGELERVGSYETGFVENDDNHEWWALPNVIGIAPK